MMALCEEWPPDCASAASRFGKARAPPISVPPTVRKSRRLRPSQKPPLRCGRPKIVSMKAPLLTDECSDLLQRKSWSYDRAKSGLGYTPSRNFWRTPMRSACTIGRMEAEAVTQLRAIADRLRELKPAPEATVFYELMSNALVWSDEIPDLESGDVSVYHCLRFVFRFRTTLMMGKPDERFRSLWD